MLHYTGISYTDTRSKSREEIEETKRIVNIVEHCGHSIAFTVDRARPYVDYLAVVKQHEGALSRCQPTNKR